jgi:hypothetical protein
VALLDAEFVWLSLTVGLWDAEGEAERVWDGANDSEGLADAVAEKERVKDVTLGDTVLLWLLVMLRDTFAV